MATVDNTGISPVTLDEYKRLLEDSFRDKFGNTLSTEPETPTGQIISIAALMLAESDESLVRVANGMGVNTASGIQLDDLATLLHVERIGATHTQVSCTMSGVAGTAIPAGSRVKKDNGDEFLLLSSVTIGSDGTVVSTFQAVDSGPVEALAGTVNTIVTLISGFETVNNSADQISLGRNQESDFSLRNRYDALTAQNSISTTDALRSAIFNAGARKVRIEENDTGSAVVRQGLTIAARGVMALVLGGSIDSIAAAVLRHKPLGVAMSGNQPHSEGAANGVFQTVTQSALRVNLTINAPGGGQFPGDGITRIRKALTDYAAGRFAGDVGQFEIDGFQIGEVIDQSRLRVPIYSIPGHTITTLEVKVKGNGGVETDTDLPATPNLDILYTVASDDISITVTTS